MTDELFIDEVATAARMDHLLLALADPHITLSLDLVPLLTAYLAVYRDRVRLWKPSICGTIQTPLKHNGRMAIIYVHAPHALQPEPEWTSETLLDKLQARLHNRYF